MTTAIDTTWLTEICDSECSERQRDIIGEPWLLDIDGETWSVATDGRVLVAVKKAGDFKSTNATREKTLREVIKQATSQEMPHTFRLSELKAWSGTPPLFTPCKGCNGKGTRCCFECGRDGAECDECDGDGKEINIVMGSVFGVFVNKALVWKAIKGLSEIAGDAECQCGAFEFERVVIGMEGAMIVLMGMDPKHEEKKAADCFKPKGSKAS